MATKKKPTESRRAKVEELRTQQKVAERKRTLIVVGIFALVGIVIIGLALIPIISSWRDSNRAFAEFGVAAAEADCGEIIDEPTSGNNDHVADGTRVEYETSPPSSGRHYGVTAGFQRHFYTRDDVPPLENLVHNLEHGATIVWYGEEASDTDVETLDSLVTRLVEEDPKVIVAPWDSEDRGEFPEGTIALSHWGAEIGHRQYCGAVSGEAIRGFVEAYPYTDSPEPQGG